jgi:thymidine kinase
MTSIKMNFGGSI